MEIKNFMEDFVEDVIEDMVSVEADVCFCEACRLDIAALALNRLPPKYIVTEKGRAFTKVESL